MILLIKIVYYHFIKIPFIKLTDVFFVNKCVDFTLVISKKFNFFENMFFYSSFQKNVFEK